MEIQLQETSTEIEEFEKFFRNFYEEELTSASQEGKKSIVVDFSLLDKFNPGLADRLLNDPEPVLKSAKGATKSFDISQESSGVEVRFKNLPEQSKIRIRNLRSAHLGKFVCIDGVVRRASEVKPEITVASFKCPECHEIIKVEQKERSLTNPVSCQNCGNRRFERPEDFEVMDSRWLNLEEPYEIAGGEGLGTVSVYFKNDLTTPEMQRKTDPGSRLIVNGIVKDIKKVFRGKMKTQMDIFIEGNYVEPTEI